MPLEKTIRKQFYGPPWEELSFYIRVCRAANRCEWCRAENYRPHWKTKSKVVLTVAHLNHTPGDDRLENLAALCQRCHLNLDREQHVQNAKQTWRKKHERAVEIADAQRPLLAFAALDLQQKT